MVQNKISLSPQRLTAAAQFPLFFQFPYFPIFIQLFFCSPTLHLINCVPSPFRNTVHFYNHEYKYVNLIKTFMAANIFHFCLFLEVLQNSESVSVMHRGEAACISCSMINCSMISLESSKCWKCPSMQPHLPEPVRQESALNTLPTVVTQDPQGKRKSARLKSSSAWHLDLLSASRILFRVCKINTTRGSMERDKYKNKSG